MELVVLADVLVRVVAAAPAMVVVTRAITSNGFIAAVDDFVVPCGLKAAHGFFSRIGVLGRHQPHTGEKMVVRYGLPQRSQQKQTHSLIRHRLWLNNPRANKASEQLPTIVKFLRDIGGIPYIAGAKPRIRLAVFGYLSGQRIADLFCELEGIDSSSG
jgi:hypothetical protein